MLTRMAATLMEDWGRRVRLATAEDQGVNFATFSRSPARSGMIAAGGKANQRWACEQQGDSGNASHIGSR